MLTQDELGTMADITINDALWKFLHQQGHINRYNKQELTEEDLIKIVWDAFVMVDRP